MVAVRSMAIIAVIKIWHLLEISIGCFAWEVQPGGRVRSTKWLLHGGRGRAGAGSTRWLGDLHSQPSGEKLEARPEVSTSADHQR